MIFILVNHYVKNLLFIINFKKSITIELIQHLPKNKLFFKKVDNIEKFKSFKNIYLSLKYLFNFKLLFGKKLRVL